MAESAEARAPGGPVPEPGLSPREIIAPAQALIPEVREQRDEAERLGHHTEALERDFVRAGFYRILQSRLFSGYEFDLPTFWKATLAIATGDPGTGWGVTLGAYHALVVGAHFAADGQRQIFGPAGDFRCPYGLGREPPAARGRTRHGRQPALGGDRAAVQPRGRCAPLRHAAGSGHLGLKAVEVIFAAAGSAAASEPLRFCPRQHHGYSG